MRLQRFCLIPLALLLGVSGVAASPQEVGARTANALAEVEVSDWHWAIDDLGFADVTDLALSEAHDRIVIAGDNKVALWDFEEVEFVAETIVGGQPSEVRIFGESVFVAPGDGSAITELSLASGDVLNRWQVDKESVPSLAVTDEFVWFVYEQSGGYPGVGRIRRSTGLVEDALVGPTVRDGSLIRASSQFPDTLWLGTGGFLDRLSVEGLDVSFEVGQGIARDGSAGLEISADGSRLWWSSGLTWELSAQSLEETDRVRPAGQFPQSNGDIAISSSGGDGFVNVAQLWGVSTIRYYSEGQNDVALEIDLLSEEAQVALADREILAVILYGQEWQLHGIGLDFQDRGRDISVFVDRHGEGPTEPRTIRLICGDYAVSVAGIYGEWTTVTIPSALRECVLMHLPSGGLETIFASLKELDPDGNEEPKWESMKDSVYYFDPLWTSTFAVFDVGASPTNSLDLFVDQTFIDVANRSPSPSEKVDTLDRIRSGNVSRTAFVLEMMDGADQYETLRAPLARLYEAFFLRASDAPGISFWVETRRSGTTLPSVAEYFASSPEFVTRYGSLTDREFIDLVYQNVLDRTPDQPGYQYWLGQMNQGLTRGDLMVYFSGSPEYQGLTSARVFAVYAVRTLEHREPTALDIQQLRAVYGRGGRDAVIAAILEGNGYYSRFWSSATESQASRLLADVQTATCDACDVARIQAFEARSALTLGAKN